MIDFYNEAFTTLQIDQRVKIFPTAFWTSIIEGPYSLDENCYSTYYRKKYTKQLEKDKRGESIFSKYNKIGFVINIQNAHWILAVIDNLRQKIQVYDSLLTERSDDPHKRKTIEKILKMFIKDEALESKVALTSIEAETLADCYESENVYCPLQSGTDCGPHVVKNFESLLLGEGIDKNSYDLSQIKALRSDVKDLLLELGTQESKPLKEFRASSAVVGRFLEKLIRSKREIKREGSPFGHIKAGKLIPGNYNSPKEDRTPFDRPNSRSSQVNPRRNP